MSVGFICVRFIILLYYILYIILYIIHYIILYTILSSSSDHSSIPLLIPSSTLIYLPTPLLPFQSFLFFFSPIPPLLSSPPPPISSSFPIFSSSFILYLSIVIYVYLYSHLLFISSLSKNITPHVLSDGRCVGVNIRIRFGCFDPAHFIGGMSRVV